MIRSFRSRAVATAALVSMVVSPTAAFANDAPTACPDGQVASSGFEDTKGTVHEQNIDCILDYGITQGLNATRYGPTLNVSRAQMATFLARTIDLAAALPAATDQGFQDIRGTVHEDRINQLAAVGVANGTSANTFSPNLSISRGQMAVFLVRAWEASTDEVLRRQGTRRFNDTEGTAFADAIDVAFEMGWTKGTTSGNYNPGAPVSRGAMASFIARFLEDLSARGSIGKGSAPSLTAFTIGDNDGSGTITDGDTLTLKYNQDMIANSSITIQDADGTRTTIDDETTAGVADGRTAATLVGSGTDTLTFTLTEAPDLAAPGSEGADGILNGTITITAASGISAVAGQAWVPGQDDEGNKTGTLTPTAPPAGGGGGGGGGGTPPPDTTPPTAPVIAFDTPFVDETNYTDVPVSGSAEAAATVDVTVVDSADGEVTGQTTATGGVISTTLDLSTLADGLLTMTATATDGSGNVSDESAPANVVKSAPPAAPVIVFATDPITEDNLADVVVTGTAQDGSTVTVVLVDVEDDRLTQTAVATDGVFEVDFDLDEAGSIDDGTVTIMATATDAQGTSTATTLTVAKDATAPDVFIEYLESPITSAAQALDVLVTGTATAGDAVSVDLQFNDTNPDVPPIDVSDVLVDASGLWSVEVDLSGLDEGLFEVVATVFDAVGNSSGDFTSGLKDTGAPAAPTVMFDADYYNAETQGDAQVTGTAEADTQVQLDVTDGDGLVIISERLTVDPSGDWMSSVFSLSPASQGTVTATAFVVGSPNSVSVSDTAIKDTIAPDAPTLVFGVDFVNPDNQEDVPLTGTAEDGSEVDVTITGPVSCFAIYVTIDPCYDSFTSTATAMGDSFGLFENLSVFIDGTITATAVATDVAGNTSAVSDVAEVLKDTKAPVAPSGVVIADGDELLNAVEAATVVVSGNATSDMGSALGSVTVTLTDSAGAVITATAVVVDGAWQTGPIDLSVTTFADGLFTATATVTDEAGNTSDDSAEDTSTLDTMAPDAPTDVVIDSGGDEFVNADEADEVWVSGTAEAASEVEITLVDSEGTVVTDTATADETTGEFGAWFDFATEFAEGLVTATATATDEAGNTSDESLTDTATLDTEAPDPPSGFVFVPDPLNLTGSDEVVIGLTAEANALVVITSIVDGNPGNDPDAGPVVATETVTAGRYETAPVDLSGLEDGDITATAYATDEAGNTSDAGVGEVEKDVQPPNAPTVNFADDLINEDEASDITLTGTSTRGVDPNPIVDEEDGTRIDITITDQNDKVVTATAIVLGGAWTASDISVTPLADGPLTAVATATDPAGNKSNVSEAANSTLDTTDPDAPTVFFADDVINEDEAPAITITGTAAATTVTVTATIVDSLGAEIVTATADIIGGEWSITGIDVSGRAQGTLTVTAIATDEALNDSVESDADTAMLDTVDPLAPSIAFVDGGDDYVNSGEAAAPLVVTGTAEAGSEVVVTLSADGTYVDDMVTDAHATTGAYSVSFDVSGVSDGTLTAIATAEDAAGNVSVDSKEAETELDTTAPVITLVVFDPDPIALGDSSSVTISGTAEVADLASVSIVVSDTNETSLDVTATGTAEGDAFEVAGINLSTQAEGEVTASVIGTDLAGNVGLATEGTSRIDRTGPDEPVILGVPDYINLANEGAVEITGTATPVSDAETVVVVLSDADGNESPPAVAMVVDGVWTAEADASTLNDTAITVTATAYDGAGNASATDDVEVAATTKDTVAPAAPTGVTIAPDPINGDTDQTTVTVSGSHVEDGVTITVTLTDSASAVHGPFEDDGPVAGNAWSVTIDTTAYAEGTFTATAVATDPAGNTSVDSAPDTATKDTVAPTVAAAQPLDNDGNTTVHFTVTEATTGPVVIANGLTAFTVNGNCGGVSCTATAYEVDGSDIVVTLNAAPDTPGTVQLGAGEAADGAGNTNTDAATAPFAPAPVELWTAYWDMWGPLNVVFVYSPGGLGSYAPSPTHFTFDTPGTGSGYSSSSGPLTNCGVTDNSIYLVTTVSLADGESVTFDPSSAGLPGAPVTYTQGTSPPLVC